MSETRWKALTHDYRSPVQGGDPLFDGGMLPYELPEVLVDESPASCAAGWHACREPHRALEIAGLWPDDRPSTLWLVESDRWLDRRDQSRCARCTVLRQATRTEYEAAIRRHAEAFGAPHADEMSAAILAWSDALARPHRDASRVERGLREALDARGLARGTLRRFDTAGDAWAARGAYTREAWDANGAWNARAAWAALTVRYAALVSRRSKRAPDLLDRGMLDAYRYGLAVAVPTGRSELGWALADDGPEVGYEEEI